MTPKILELRSEADFSKLKEIPDNLFDAARKEAEAFAEAEGMKASEKNNHEDVGTAYTSSSAYPLLWYVANSRKGGEFVDDKHNTGVGFDGSGLVLVRDLFSK